MVGNLVVEIEIFNFCLFVCTSRFANFARGKWSNHDSENCSEIRTVTWLVIWLWKLKFSIFVCLFVYLFVCTSRFANFTKGKWSNHDSKNCSEIRAVTWLVIWLWKLQFTILIFFTPLYCPYNPHIHPLLLGIGCQGSDSDGDA